MKTYALLSTLTLLLAACNGSGEETTAGAQATAAPTNEPGRTESIAAVRTGASLPTSRGSNARDPGNAPIAALRHKDANHYSDLLLHDVGSGLADGVAQGQASGQAFRTAPLWGLGQRLFFLRDGRTADLKQAVLARRGEGSEANGVVSVFNGLADREQQDWLNFLRSL